MKTIYAHIHREEGKHYLEDKYTQYEINGMYPGEVERLFGENGEGEVYVCSDRLINIIGIMIAEGFFISDEFEIITKKFVSHYSREGFLTNWEIGYMMGPTFNMKDNTYKGEFKDEK